MKRAERASRLAFIAVEVLLLAAIPVIAWIGFQTVLDTTAGQAVDPELDPDEPGYEAFVGSTPVGLLAGVDGAGALSWVTVAVLSGPEERGGALLLVPPATLVDVPELGTVSLAAAFAAEGRTGLYQGLGGLLDIGFDEVVIVEPARLTEVLAPASPLPFTFPDDVPGFERGEQVVDAARLPELLAARGAEESDLVRMTRHEAFWRAWLAAVATSSNPDVVPGEQTAGIGRFVRGVAAGTATLDVLPVNPVEVLETGEEAFDPDDEEVAALVDERVPFPVAATPGGRPRVRVLDGVGADGLALRAARDAARGGGQIVVLGNADRFGAATSRVVYFDAGWGDDAAEVAAALGISDVQRQEGPNPNDLVDVTVVVGSDLAEAYGLVARDGGAETAG